MKIVSSRDPKYTQAIALAALERIAALGLPADPDSFAVWYAYCAAQNPEINQKLNDLLAGKTKLSVADVQRIWDEHLSPVGSLARIEKVRDDLANEVDFVVDLIEEAATGVAVYQANLDDAHGRLARPADRDSIRAIVRNLVQSSKEMEERNQALETALRVAKQVIENLQDDMNDIRSESECDSLTSLVNRKHFDKILNLAVAEATTTRVPFSILLIDVDYFKDFNDNHGHQTGDDVLRLIAATLKESIKGRDIAGRYGGDEFVALLPDTGLERAWTVGENVCTAIAGKAVCRRSTGEELGRLTVSVGVATFRSGDTPDLLIARADNALYAAKKKGRNTTSAEGVFIPPKRSAAL